MGTLIAVDLKSESNLSRNISLNDINKNPANFSLSIMGEITVALPNSENISMNVNQTFDSRLSGYDSGRYSSSLNRSDIIAVEPAFKSYLAIDDFEAAFAGEKAVLPVMTSFYTQIRSFGSANPMATLKANASVCISYTYEPKTANEGDVDES